jgi:hypothetical protein
MPVNVANHESRITNYRRLFFSSSACRPTAACALPTSFCLFLALPSGLGVDPFRLCVALAPLAVYLLVLGAINLSRRPLVVSGARDFTALGLAVSGLMLVGPIELLAPRLLTMHFGWIAWLMWIGFYLTTLSLIASLQLPRLTIYNISLEELRPVLTTALQALDPDARWTGDTVLLPQAGMQLHIDSFSPMRNVLVSSLGRRQNLQGWRQLEADLTLALKQAEVAPNPRGVTFLMIGSLLVGAIGIKWLSDPQAVARSFVEMMGL